MKTSRLRRAILLLVLAAATAMEASRADNSSNSTTVSPSTNVPTTTASTPSVTTSTPSTTAAPIVTTTSPPPTTTTAPPTTTSLAPTTTLPPQTTPATTPAPTPTTTAPVATAATPSPPASSIATPSPSSKEVDYADNLPTPTFRLPRTSTTPVPTPTSNDSDNGAVGTIVVAGVSAAAVVLLGLAAFFVHKRRQAYEESVDTMILSHRHLDQSNLPSPTNRGNRPPPPFKARPTNSPALLVEHDSVMASVATPSLVLPGRKSGKKRSPPSGKTTEIAVLGGGNDVSHDDDRASSFFTWDSHRGGVDDAALQRHLDKHVNYHHPPSHHPGSFDGTAASFPLHVPSALSRPSPQYRTPSNRESNLSFVSQKSMSYNDHVTALNTDEDMMNKFSFLSNGSVEVTAKAFQQKETLVDPALLSMTSSVDIHTTKEPLHLLDTMQHAPMYSFDGSDRDSYDSIHYNRDQGSGIDRNTNHSTESGESGYNI